MKVKITGYRKIRITGLPKAEYGTQINGCADDEYWDGTKCVKIRPYEQIFDTEGTVGGYDQNKNQAYGLGNYGYNNRRGYYTDDATGKTMDARTGQPAPADYTAPNPTDYESWYNTFNQDYGTDLEQFNPGIRTEAGDLLYNAGVDPRIYMLDQYIKTVEGNAAGLSGRGGFRAANKAGVWTDPTKETAFNTIYDQYKDKITTLPVDQQRNLMNQGRQFFYSNTNRGNIVNGKFVASNDGTGSVENPATLSWYQRYGLPNYGGKFKNRQDPNAPTASTTVPTINGNKDETGKVTTPVVTPPPDQQPVVSTEQPTTTAPITTVPSTEPVTTVPTIEPTATTVPATTEPAAQTTNTTQTGTTTTNNTTTNITSSNDDPNSPDYIPRVSLDLSKRERRREARKGYEHDQSNVVKPKTFFDQIGVKTNKFNAGVEAFKGMTDKLGVVGQFIGDRNKQKDYDQWARNQRFNSAAVVPANRSGNRGNYSVTGSSYGAFRQPEQGFTNEGRYMNNPGMKIRAFGGAIDDELSLPSEMIQITSTPTPAPQVAPETSSAPASSETSGESYPVGEGLFSPLKNFVVTSGYGRRKAPKGPQGFASSEHNGIDLAVGVNTNIYAPMDGVVKSIYQNPQGGNQLIIQHSDGSKTGYAHLNGYKVNIGDPVAKGQIVALSGNTGNSNGPHLHFTYRNPQGEQIDPDIIFNFTKKRKAEPQNNTSSSFEVNPMAQKTWDDISTKFKGVTNLGIGGDWKHKLRTSDHNTGNALDIGINSITAGNQIAQKLINEASDRNIKYLIFNRRIWSPNSGWQTYTPNKQNGNDPHTDHVHASFYGNTKEKKYAYGGVIDESLDLPSDVISSNMPLPQPITSEIPQAYQAPVTSVERTQAEEGPLPSSWEHYNPGNIHYGEFAKTYNAKIGRKDSDGRVAIFPDMETGMQAMKDLIFGEGYKNLTVSQARNRWVNGKPTVTTVSTMPIVKAMGGDFKLRDLNEEERNKLVAEFIKWEDRRVYDRLKKQKVIFAEGGSVDEITCSNCGWSWTADESDPSDVNVCHKCGFNNNTIDNDMKIRITGGPKQMAYGGQSGYGFDLGQRNTYSAMSQNPYENSSKTLGPVPRDQANVEAEEGETVFGDIDKDGQREHMLIGGKKHTQGGTPLNVPEGSFIFSDTKKMRIKDPEVLNFFGLKPIKEGYTPAEIAKRYDVNKYKAILQDPLADAIKKRTAQLMMENYEKKLGYLALIQESMKGFPQGLPKIAEEVLGTTKQGQQALQNQGQQQMPQQGQEEMPQEEMMPPQEMPQQGMEEQMMEAPEEEQGEEMPPMQMYGGSPYAYGGTFAFNDGTYIPQDYGEMAYGGNVQYADEGTEVGNRKKKKVKTKDKGEVEAEVYPKGSIPTGYVPYPGSVDLWWIPGKPGSLKKGTIHKGRKIGGGGRAIKGCENLLYTIADTKARPNCYKTFLETENWKNAPLEEQIKALKELAKGQRLTYQSPDIEEPGTDPQYATIEDTPPPVTTPPKYKWRCTENGPVKVDVSKAGPEEGFSDPITHEWVTSDMMGYGDESQGGPYYETKEEAEKVCKPEKPKTPPSLIPPPIFPGMPPNFDSAAAIGPKKYHPWAARLEQYMPNPAFLSPERELAENAGLATAMSRGYTGSPQQYAAMANAAQQGAVGNAANIIARVSNQNVGIANQYSPLQAGIMNDMMKYDANRQDILHQNENMYDKEYRNTWRKWLTDRDKVKKGMYEYVTKRNILNATNPYYNVIDTPQGGMIQMRPGVGAYNTIIGPGATASTAASYRQRLDEYKQAGYSDGQIKLLLDQEFGPSRGGSRSSDVNAWNQAYINNTRNVTGSNDDDNS